MRITLRPLALMLSLSFAACTADVAVAQFGPPGGFGGRGRGGGGFDSPTFMLRRDDVQQELKLSEDQIKQITAFQDGLRDNNQFRDFFDRMRQAKDDEERRAIGTEMQNFQENALKKIVKAEQWNRLQQLSFQRQGSRALENEDYQKQLNLSDSQKEAVRKANDDYDKARDEIFRNRDLSTEERTAKLEELRLKRDKDAEKVLNPQQRSAIEEKRGSSFTFQDNFGGGRPGGGGPQTQPGGNDTRRGGGTSGRPRNVDAAAVGSNPSTTDGDGQPATLSFGGKDGEKKKLSKLSFNFRFAPWVDVLKLFADASGLTLDLNDVPTGSFNYYDEREYTPAEALDVLNGYLIQKGYILVRRDEFLVVINIDDGIPPNLVPTVPLAEMPSRGRNELMTVIVPIEGMTPHDAADEVKELLGPQGKVVALNRANKLIITDIGSNLRRIHELLTSLSIEPGDKLFKQFALKHVDAIDAENVVRDLFGLPRRGIENVSAGSGFNGDPRSSSSSSSSSSRSSRSPNQDPNLRVAVTIDERTNTLLVTAKSEDMKTIEEILKTVDVDTGNDTAGRGSKQPYFHVYELKSADPMEVTKTLNVLFPGTVVNEDGRARRIHIRATAAMHQQIEQTLKQLDGAGGTTTQVAVIPLGRMDAYTATASIQSLFISEGNSAPVVQPHPLGTGLIVKGTGDQVNQIKLLLAQLDPASGGFGSQQGNVRTIPLGGRNPEEFLKMLEQAWGGKGRNPIRTVTPSASKKGEGESATESSRTQSLRKVLGAPAPDARPVDNNKPAATNDAEPAKPRGLLENGKSASLDRRASSQLASYTEVVQERFVSDDAVAQTQDQPASKAEVNAQFEKLFQATDAADAGAAKTEERKADPNIPILITVRNGNLVVMSEDPVALDQLEDVIASVSKALPPKTEWTVFYLRSADALESATVLERLFPTSSVSTSGGSSSGMLGELTSGISSMGRGLMDMTGLNSISNGPQTLRIIPDTRTNSLFVSGPSHMVNEVEDMLRVLDASETPEQLSKRTPRYIEVKHAELSEVVELVRDIFREELEGERGGAQQANPLAALMGAQGGGGRGGRGGAGAAQTVKMTIGIDARSNRLVVASSEPLFKQVEALVGQIDQAAFDSKRTVRVVSLEHMKTSQLKSALGAVMPKIKVSSSRGGSGSGGGESRPSTPQPQQPNPDEIRQLIQMQQGGGGGRGGNGGGGFPGGGFPGGGFPGGGGRGR